MLCNDPTRENWCLSSKAGDRSTCGNKKWCKNGVCVFDKHAPAVSDDCVFGDQTIGIAAYGLTCEQFKLPENQWRCYDSFTRTKCCQTCQAIKRANAGCEYGNRSSWCHSNIRSEKDKRICYYGSNADLCCESCTAFADKANQGCEYGDRLTGCKADICNRYSYDVRRKCCQTCKAGPTKG